jgi:TnpA family transposase
MLGFRFCPRLRDFPDRKLASIEPATAYPTLQPLLGRRIKVDVIREHWHEVVRLVASLKAGTVAPSAMLRSSPHTSARISSIWRSRNLAASSARSSCSTGWKAPSSVGGAKPD